MSDGSGYSTLADVPETLASGSKDERPVIVLRSELMPMTDEAISALARLPGIYQREGFLVDILPSAELDGLSRISQIPASRPGRARHPTGSSMWFHGQERDG